MKNKRWVPKGPSEDERIMSDGRPAYAWWNELTMLRSRDKQLYAREQEIMEKLKVLRIAEWAFAKDCLSGDVIVRIRQLPLVLSKAPMAEFIEHPEDFCEITKRERGSR